VRVEAGCARCAVPVGGLRRISDRDELASAAVGGGEARTRKTSGRIFFSMADLLPGPYWPLLWARVTASAVMAVFIAHALVPGAKTRIQTSDFDMARLHCYGY
jgi:hypothetical protein